MYRFEKERLFNILQIFASLLFFIFSGCTAAEFQQHTAEFVKDVGGAYVEHETNKVMGNYDGSIDSVRVRTSNSSGYLLEVLYSSVDNPYGVSIVAEAQGPYGELPEYTSAPVPISQESGREGVIVHYDGGGSYNQGNDPGPATNIIVKLVRDDTPSRAIASVNYVISQGSVQNSPGSPQNNPSYPIDNTPSPINATPGYCQGYASLAVEQYNQAVQLRCPGISPLVWGNDYNAHYSWCVTVPVDNASEQKMYRTNFLNDCYTNSQNNGTISAGQAQVYDPNKAQDQPMIKLPSTSPTSSVNRF
jgi:hypothetical protein